MAKQFTAGSFLWRLLGASALVFSTYNPITPYSYYERAIAPAAATLSLPTAIQSLLGVILIIGWAIFLRATSRSLGLIGVLLAAALVASFVWVMIDQQWMSLDGSGTLQWTILIALSLVLATGISWSHIRRRMTGQIDVDELESE